MSRVKVYEAEDIARNIRETFTAKKAMKRHAFNFNWPSVWQNIGDSLAVAYASDKWKDDGDYELYKHLAESRNHAFCVPGFLRDFDNPKKEWPTIGPMVSFADVPMPREFAILALFEELDLQLHVDGTDDDPQFGEEDEGVVKVTVAHGILGASKILWEESPEPFLFIYTEKDGPLVFIIGEELDVLADGIVG
jgi:hypothetical protein